MLMGGISAAERERLRVQHAAAEHALGLENELAAGLASCAMKPAASTAAFGKRLRRLRASKGLTQSDVALPHYTAAYVSTIEAGRRMPSRAALEHFASKLGVDVEQLLTGRPPDLPARLELQLQDARGALANGNYDEAERLLSEVANAANRYGLVRVQARAEIGRARNDERQGRIDQALEHFEAADALLASEPIPLRAEAVAGIARCLQMQGDTRYSIHLLESYLMLLEKEQLPDPTAVMRANSALVSAYSEVGLYDRAYEAATRALQLQTRVDDPEQIACMHVNVARALVQRGAVGDALESLKRAEDIYHSFDWKTELARAHLARGLILSDQGDLAAARKELEYALEIFVATGSSVDQGRALNELARLERRSGRPAEARNLAQRAIDILDNLDVGELALAHQQLGLGYADHDPELAEKNLRRAIDLYKQAGEQLQVARTYRELGDLLCEQGRSDAGLEAFREGLVAVGDR